MSESSPVRRTPGVAGHLARTYGIGTPDRDGYVRYDEHQLHMARALITQLQLSLLTVPPYEGGAGPVGN